MSSLPPAFWTKAGEGFQMKPVLFDQVMILLIVCFIFVLVLTDRSIPAPLLLVLGVLCPSPLQSNAAKVLSLIGGGTNGGEEGTGSKPA